LSTPSAAIERATCPFIGLRPFDEPDARWFFGRTEQVAALLRRLGEARFLAVVGTSGCGKSSLVRAGLIPALKRGYLAGTGTRWKIAVMRPGGDPFGALARHLDRPELLGPQRDRLETLQRSSLGLVESARRDLDARESLLLVVDQFEELFRFRREVAGADEQADAFVKLLLASAEQDEVPIYVVLTMRSDYLGDCAVFRGLPEALNDAQYLVPVLTRRQLREVIEEPVASAGAQVAPELVQRLLNDVGQGLEQELDQLPVLQHALMRTWGEAVGAPELQLKHYWDSGGMSGALNQHAQELCHKLSQEDQALAQRVFQRLTEKEFTGRDIRRPTSFGELLTMTGASEEQLTRVLGQFQDFLTATPEPPKPPDPPFTDASMIDITHEALIRQWKELREWAKEEAQSAQVYVRLDYDASRRGRPWEDPDLSEALKLRRKNAWNPTWAQRYTPDEQAWRQVEEFLKKSKRHRLRKRGLRVVLVLALLAIPAAWYYWRVQSTKHQAELQRKEAEIERVRTQSDIKAAEADRLAAQAAAASGAERARLEKEAGVAREQSRTLAASAKDYETLSQKREAELAELRRSRDDFEHRWKMAEGDKTRLKDDKTAVERKLAEAQADAERVKADLARKLESANKENEILTAKLAAIPPSPGAIRKNPRDGLEYVRIPPGKFSMGCSPGDQECDDDEKPAREVTISKEFWMGQTEVTQAAYRKVIGGNPSFFKGENLPVETVSWTEAVRYCEAAGGRLPTEAEWEYAARGGTAGPRYGELDAIAWYSVNSASRTHEVKGKQPNAFFLYDMLGNVWEWTADWYGPYQGAATVDPRGPSSRMYRVLRGGSWFNNPWYARASFRDWGVEQLRYSYVGFRCVGEIP